MWLQYFKSGRRIVTFMHVHTDRQEKSKVGCSTHVGLCEEVRGRRASDLRLHKERARSWRRQAEAQEEEEAVIND